MEVLRATAPVVGSTLFVMACSYLFWRYFWFFRNPGRSVPEGENVISPADGTVVYVKRVEPHEPVVSIKEKRNICLSDIVRADLSGTKLLVGIFMSPFNVHYNRTPISGRVERIQHHPARLRNHHMGSMHWRSVLKRFPIYKHSVHVVENERTVTRFSGHFKGWPVSCYVVQIAGGSVNGIDSYIWEGSLVEKGSVFGMIRIGSQVDLIITCTESMDVKVRPGERVKAGETVLIE